MYEYESSVLSTAILTHSTHYKIHNWCALEGTLKCPKVILFPLEALAVCMGLNMSLYLKHRINYDICSMAYSLIAISTFIESHFTCA